MPWYNPISITVVWSGGIAAKRSLKLQNRAARILTSSSYDADAGYLLQQLGWRDLIAQRQIQVPFKWCSKLLMILLLTNYPLCLLSALRPAMS